MCNRIRFLVFAIVLACLAIHVSAGVSLAELQFPPHLVLGHGGVSVPYIDGQWNLKVVDSTSGSPTDYTTNEALFYLNQNTAVDTNTIPASAYAWLGTTAGQTIYIAPQTLKADTAYFGFNLRGMTAADKESLAAWEPDDPRLGQHYHDHGDADGGGEEDAEAWIRIDLLSVRGLGGGPAPGVFSLWTADDDGVAVWMSTAQTPEEGNTFYLDVEHGHSHVNWGFTSPGVYEIEFQASTYLAGETPVLTQSAPTTYYFGVLEVPEPSTFAMLTAVLLAAFGSRCRKVCA